VIEFWGRREGLDVSCDEGGREGGREEGVKFLSILGMCVYLVVVEW